MMCPLIRAEIKHLNFKFIFLTKRNTPAKPTVEPVTEWSSCRTLWFCWSIWRLKLDQVLSLKVQLTVVKLLLGPLRIHNLTYFLNIVSSNDLKRGWSQFSFFLKPIPKVFLPKLRMRPCCVTLVQHYFVGIFGFLKGFDFLKWCHVKGSSGELTKRRKILSSSSSEIILFLNKMIPPPASVPIAKHFLRIVSFGINLSRCFINLSEAYLFINVIMFNNIQ